MITPSKKILISSFEVPNFGGASTSAYRLFEQMQTDGCDVLFLNLIVDENLDYFENKLGPNFENPRTLKNVYSFFVKEPKFKVQKELGAFVATLNPDLIIGVGFIPALILKKALPSIHLVFLTVGTAKTKDKVGSWRYKNAVALQKYLSKKILPPANLINLRIKETVRACDLIIAHSEMTHFIYSKLYSDRKGKIYSKVVWFAEWIYEEALIFKDDKRPFEQRQIDLLFVANDWTRSEKNFNILSRITSACNLFNVHIVGEVPYKIKNAVHHGLLSDRKMLFALMGNAKVLVCPSLIDAAPGILFEGAAMGCNLVASRNCGNWQICNETLLVDPISTKNFIRKCQMAAVKKYDDNWNYFSQRKSYKDLIETLAVF